MLSIFRLARSFSTTTGKGTVGFIGLGKMGAPMARNLEKAGHRVIVYDNDLSKLGQFSNKTESIKDLAKQCQRIITMLPNNSIVQKVFFESNILKDASKNSTFIDCSTVSPSVGRTVAEKCKESGHLYLDAPVSGGVRGAEEGTLTFLVGGDKKTLSDNEDIFQAMGKKTIYCGETGSGQVAKLCNNMILGVSMVALSEALNLASRLGLDPQVMTDVINASSGRSWSSETYNPVPGILQNAPATKDYEGGFALRLLLKDLFLALEEAKACGTRLPTGERAYDMYGEMVGKHNTWSEKDFSIIYKYLKDQK